MGICYYGELCGNVFIAMGALSHRCSPRENVETQFITRSFLLSAGVFHFQGPDLFGKTILKSLVHDASTQLCAHGSRKPRASQCQIIWFQQVDWQSLQFSDYAMPLMGTAIATKTPASTHRGEVSPVYLPEGGGMLQHQLSSLKRLIQPCWIKSGSLTLLETPGNLG